MYTPVECAYRFFIFSENIKIYIMFHQHFPVFHYFVYNKWLVGVQNKLEPNVGMVFET